MPLFEQPLLDLRVDEILNRRPTVGLAVGVVRGGSVDSFTARGVADVTTGEPITQDTVFRIASISKTLTAVAIMQLWEQGLLDLDAPANDCLRAFQLVPAKPGWRPATVRHLLTHTAGVPEWLHPLDMVKSGWFAETFALEEPLPTLAQYYRGALRLAAEPGTTWTYTDHGFGVLGQIVEDLSGQPLHRYLREHIFDPLGMPSSDLLRSEAVRARLATGYTLGRKGASAVTDRHGVTPAAGAVYSSPRDMGRYLAALLAGGSGEHGSILKPDTVATMFAPHYQPDPRIAGMGLAFWRVDLGGHRAVEHQGVVPGFNSQIYLAPDDGAAVMTFSNGAGSTYSAGWVMGETERLLRDVVGVPPDRIRTDVPHHPELWSLLCGWYRPRAQRTDMMAWAMMGAGVQVRVQRGRLAVRCLSPIPALLRGLPLHPDDEYNPYVFRLDLSAYGIGLPRVVFSQDATGAVSAVRVDGHLLSADKRSS